MGQVLLQKTQKNDTGDPHPTGGGVEFTIQTKKGDIMNIADLWNTIKAIFSQMWPAIWPSVKIMLTEAGKYTLATAINVVKKVQEDMPTATGAEKAAAAFAQISAILVSQGIQVGTGMIKLAIEYAYQHMVAEPEVIEEAKGMVFTVDEMKKDEIIPEWVK